MRPRNLLASFLLLLLLLPAAAPHAQTQTPRRGAPNVESGARRPGSRAAARGPAEEEPRGSGVWDYVYWVLYAAAAWALGLLALFVLGKVFSNMTMKTVESADPEELTGARHETLRRWYRALINFAGFYYYASLPVVLCLILLAAAAAVYAFVMVRFPIKLVLIIVAGVAVTVYQMIRSFFVKHEEEDPGRPLREEEAPGLWALAREVAGAVGTRPVDEIRVTPGTDLAVYERGSSAEKRQDKATRILIIGVGVLNGFTRNAFRAVLAHEYGHFGHRDTAGGEVALRVNKDMVVFAYAMAAAGQAVWYNLAFQFLRAYHFIFRRISHGATRLQDILADRVAVYNYGARLRGGLDARHLPRRGVQPPGRARDQRGRAVAARFAEPLRAAGGEGRRGGAGRGGGLPRVARARDERGRHAPRALRALPPRAARQVEGRAARRRHRLGTLRRPRSPHARDERPRLAQPTGRLS
ncbi:MAG TPA: M48 family metallopeptidase [Pyrinomonadaceae bacterium]|jgi:Zn-dependent protease with chaperone function